MNTVDNVKTIRRNDLIIAAVVVIAALAFFLFNVVFRDQGATVTITVSGKEYGTYSLEKDQEIPIVISGTETNHLVIADGKADMIWADCPDKLCVYQKEICNEHEMICCLPNEVLVEVNEGAASSGIDSVAK